jgi:hypothetical protein
MSVKKLVLPNYVDKKLQICKMSKLHIFVITNICNQIFVTFGRIGTRTDENQAKYLNNAAFGEYRRRKFI